jgi:hypothetical protein
MSDDLPIYRSTLPVPVRVDRAWGQGFDAGKAALLRSAGVTFVAGTYRVLRGSDTPVALAVPVALMVAALVIPACLLVLATRTGVRVHRAHRSHVAAVGATITGRTDWEPF